jgi:hypothetical protein
MNIYIIYIYDVYLYLWVCRPYNWGNYTLKYVVDANGHFRSRNWTYLPHIISNILSLCKGYVREYPKKYGLIWYSTSIFGVLKFQLKPIQKWGIPLSELYCGYQPLSNWNAHRRRVKQTNICECHGDIMRI